MWISSICKAYLCTKLSLYYILNIITLYIYKNSRKNKSEQVEKHTVGVETGKRRKKRNNLKNEIIKNSCQNILNKLISFWYYNHYN